jgi:hypothetical protein
MTRSIGLRAGMLAGIATLAITAFTMPFGGFGAVPAGAATTNPCKLLKKSEIQQAFGGTVGSGKKGLSTPVSAQCEFPVGADADRPNGTVIVHVMTTGAKAAYTGLKKLSSTYAPIDGVPNSLYAEKLHVVNILKGDVLVGVQGGFTITDPLPIHFYDDKTQLTDLAQIAAKRV